MRDLRVHQILEGTNEIMRLIVSRKLIEGTLMSGSLQTSRDLIVVARGALGVDSPQPAEGTQCAHARHGSRDAQGAGRV